ncbi:unnamed protein product [Rotaria sp. Silwood1]|nr:unnamed protein product [Rotaria sp. Silwood1]
MKAYIGCKERILRRLGCQSRCPGCGSKCSRPEPHQEELFEPWPQCQCASGKCTCERPEPRLLNTHGTPHHIAQAFYGMCYYKVHTPVLELCYQRWKTGSMFLGDVEIFPLQKFHNQYNPDWYNNMHSLSTEGKACDESIPPPEQCRAWMIVRSVLVPHYASRGTVVAGENGQGSRSDQLFKPWYVFVDRDHSVYVSDSANHRVMKWEEGAKQGIVVAGGQGQGDSVTQLSMPEGVVVDQSGNVYVADCYNHRIMRWSKGAAQGSVIAGGNGEGGQSNQLYYPNGLSFDRHGNLYVVDQNNNRVQKFNIDLNS